MIFTSYTYLFFLASAFALHWLLPERWRKLFLVLASYVFYCTWKWQFGFLLLGFSLFTWAWGRWVLPKARSSLPLTVGVLVDLSALLYFKYTNFIVVNAAGAIQLFGGSWHPSLSDIVLPLGISFFTFQGIAYLFDVASGEEPLKPLLDFLLFKALWPQLIAGPIVRLSEMREQIQSERMIDYADVAIGCQRILFGFFKKVVFADNLAPYVDTVFQSAGTPNALDVVVGVLGFGLQIYFDFSAYSDIAIGSARLFGFVLPENFDWPYRSLSPQQFWNHWHMTLSRWIRDYLFTPMVFASRRRPRLVGVWLLLAMAACGLWHGAQWTFVLWGVWHGLLLLSNQTVLKRVFVPEDRRAGVGRPHRLLAWVLTFSLVQAGWLLFRAQSLGHAWRMLVSVATLRGGLRPALMRENVVLFVGMLCILMAAAQVVQPWLSRQLAQARRIRAWVPVLRPLGYALMILAIIVFDQEARAFVYFQF